MHVTFRHALLSNSLVAQIHNIDDKPLLNVRVSTDKWREKYNVAAVLERDKMVEAGWMELKEGLKEGMILYGDCSRTPIFAYAFLGDLEPH